MQTQKNPTSDFKFIHKKQMKKRKKRIEKKIRSLAPKSPIKFKILTDNEGYSQSSINSHKLSNPKQKQKTKQTSVAQG